MNYTPLVGSQARRPSTFNAPLQELSDAIDALTTATETLVDWTAVASPVATITLSSIPQTHKHLILTMRMIANGGVGTLIALRVNGDTTNNNYKFTRVQTTASHVVTTTPVTRTGWDFRPGVIWRVHLLDYTDVDKDKAMRANGVWLESSTMQIWQNHGGWEFVQDAITSLQIACEDAGNILANSWYMLEGVK